MTEEMKTEGLQVEANEAAQEQSMEDVTFLKKGDVVKGKVVKVDAEQAIVDVGYKYDGVVPIRELSSVGVESAADSVEIGQEVELKVITIDDNKERLVLSKRAVDSVKAWDELVSAMDNQTIIEAKVAEVVKGGLVVDVGLRGFIPASMVERTFVEDFSDYKGRTLRLRVVEMDKEKNKVILSQKAVLDEEFEAKKKEVLGSVQVGQQLTGTVQRLTPFGAFVDIGGVDGLVHISEMAWHHVDSPSEVVKEGDQVTVKVLKVDPENERISLSIRATEAGPWDKVKTELQIGDITTGTVKRLVQFGAFVEVIPGVEGLVHVSQIAHQHVATPAEVLKEGQEVKVKVLDMNPEEKRISLSIKETEEAPAREPRPERARAPKKETVVLEEAQSLSLTLGERFGDKLSKFK